MGKHKELVYGIGTNDLANDIKTQFEIGLTPELQKECYKAWYHRIEAQDCGRATVSTEWLFYSNFARWWLATHVEDWCIDKDCLIAGNKEYHPEKCVWVPQKINTLMNDRSTNGLPKGVSIHRNSYKAQCRVNGVQKSKNFKTAIDAHRQWQLWKLEELDNVIDEFRYDQRLDKRIITRLTEVRDNIQSDYDNNIETK
ncbi:hypothetical protein [Serratia nevei]|uniref:hypothetical protein n=1 Tax=Serratia nevei TaxID=2703794 RepID=UPI003F8138D1